MKFISGFSKLDKEQKRGWLKTQTGVCTEHLSEFDIDVNSKLFDKLSENTIANFITPLGLAPNFLINNKVYTVPMVTEESSVVAAASKSAKFWKSFGGFKAEVLSMKKRGHIYFDFEGDVETLKSEVSKHDEILKSLLHITSKMDKRGGGIVGSEFSRLENNSFKLELEFITCDAMGANFINTCLEEYAKLLNERMDNKLDIIMCILSNYTPECLVRASVTAKISELGEIDGLDASQFSSKFKRAVEIARIDSDRAVTHNKGIMNGVDSVVVATGNDYRAVEACAHAYASRDGSYKSLSFVEVSEEEFHFYIDLPIAIGTIGGLTQLHPLAKFSLDILDNPSARELMYIIASVGLAQNFGAIRSLITTGIQKGHMKMHLHNILTNLNASEDEIQSSLEHFSDKIVSYSLVRSYLKRGLS